MEVYRALRDFYPSDQRGEHVIQMKRGDEFEIFEPEQKRKHKEWWGVRRLRDDVLGFVPSKLLAYEEKVPLYCLTEDYEQQREIHIRQLDAMQHGTEYRVPEPNDDPAPDYSDEEEELKSTFYRDEPKKSLLREIQPNGSRLHPNGSPRPFSSGSPRPRGSPRPFSTGSPFPNGSPLPSPSLRRPKGSRPNSNALTADEWDKIVSAADDEFPEPPEPEPDYLEDEGKSSSTSNGSLSPTIIRPHPNSSGHMGSDGNGMFMPKKLHNPCLASKERMDVHRELLYNRKMGINVLQKKSELKKALDKRTEERRKREWEEYMKSKKTVFQLKLEEQANKLKEHEEKSTKKTGPKVALKSPKNPDPPVEKKTEDDENVPEFLRVQRRINKNKVTS